MGWKLSLLARKAQPDDDFDRLAEALGFTPPATETVTFDRGLYPSPGVALASWNDHLVVLSDELAGQLLNAPEQTNPGRRTLAALGPHRLLVAGLHSVTDFYGYALFEQGRLVRGRVGAADDGVIWEQGPPFAWEDPQDDEFEGETAVFTFLTEVFGGLLDAADDELFALEFKRYQAGLKSKLKRLFGL